MNGAGCRGYSLLSDSRARDDQRYRRATCRSRPSTKKQSNTAQTRRQSSQAVPFSRFFGLPFGAARGWFGGTAGAKYGGSPSVDSPGRSLPTLYSRRNRRLASPGTAREGTCLDQLICSLTPSPMSCLTSTFKGSAMPRMRLPLCVSLW